MSTPMRHGLSQQGRTPNVPGMVATPPPGSMPFSNTRTSYVPGMVATPPPGSMSFSNTRTSNVPCIVATPPPGSTPFSNTRTSNVPGMVATPPPGSTPFSNTRTSPQVKMSPGNSSTLRGIPSDTGTMGSAINFDSPSAAAALGSLGIPGSFDITLDSISMGGTAYGRQDEDDRKQKMDTLTDMLEAAGKGRVSNEGLERLVRSMKLDCIWDENPNGGPLSKTLMIAGSGLAIDVIITNHMVENVTITLPETSASSQNHFGRAEEVLLADLKLAPGQSPLTKTLEKFKHNLKRLVNLDRLSVLPFLNCFDAIGGMYDSLLKLHLWDMQKLREGEVSRPDEWLKVQALCTSHGYPMMHARDNIGLSLEYWKERSKHPDMRVDKKGYKDWSLLIECAVSDPNADHFMYPTPVRVSDQWISDAVEKAHATEEEILSGPGPGPVLDWLEPDNIILPGPGPGGGLEVVADAKLPDAGFVAIFDPPVVVSLAVASDIYRMLGFPPPEDSATFDAMLFPPEGAYRSSEPRSIRRLQPVTFFLNMQAGEDEWKRIKGHSNTLLIHKPVYGHLLTRLPFSHPRNVVEMLPVLRQYAFLSTLLSKSFKPRQGFPDLTEEGPDPLVTTRVAAELKGFMGGAAARHGRPSVLDDSPYATRRPDGGLSIRNPPRVDIRLTVHSTPTLQIAFPFRGGAGNVTLEIQLEGKVAIVSHNVFGGQNDSDGDGVNGGEKQPEAGAAAGKVGTSKVAMFERLLETMEDIGAWIELIRYKMQ